jgi:carbon storage regulator
VLVLTRRPGESIVIGNEIVVTVLEVRHDQVRIGIAAPRSIQVHREEIFRQVAQENTSAVTDVDRASALLRRRPPRPAPRTDQGPAPRSGQAAQSGSGQPASQADQTPTSKRTAGTDNAGEELSP